MSTLLHITNGDAMTSALRKLSVPGEIITWREMLCEGRTINTVGTEIFWKERFSYLSKVYKVSKSQFIDLTLKEYRELCKHKAQDEIVLWFDADLYCQVNMIAVMSWIHKHRKDEVISLVGDGLDAEGTEPSHLSEETPQRLLKRFSNRLILTRDDLEYADYIWQLYCENNPLRLQQAIQQNTSQLQSLSTAMEAHIKRFPNMRTGLNVQEFDLLELAATLHPKTEAELLQAVMQSEKIYGYADTQYQHMITQLKPLFSSMNPVKLSSLGEKVRSWTENVYPILRNDKDFLGGAPKYAYLYVDETGQLLKL